MIHNQSAEDYLETILLLSKELKFVHQIDVSRRLGVSSPAVLKAVNLLKGKGYIKSDGMHIYLTDEGLAYAEEVYRRHCTIKKFLELHGVNSEDADNDACLMEHDVSEATMQMITEYVDKNS